MDPASLNEKLGQRKAEERLRLLQPVPGGIDFFSNDYLGVVRNGLLEQQTRDASLAHGATGSRLLGGNHPLAEKTERQIADFHRSPAALLFTSGFEANLGLISCIAGRNDTILYDDLAHASIRDGIRLSTAGSFSFAHNDLADLERLLKKAKGNCYVITESVFSMDGDQAPLETIADCCLRYNAFLIVDEAHATGVLGPAGAGLVQQLGLEEKCFARIHTFGKALGCHGAVVLGSVVLRDYLVNFSRSFIYTTALPPTAVDAIAASYRLFPGMDEERERLLQLIRHFHNEKKRLQPASASDSDRNFPGASPIQAVIIPGNARVREVSAALRQEDMAVYPVLSPTVKQGSERLRIILHSYNTTDEISALLTAIARLTS